MNSVAWEIRTLAGKPHLAGTRLNHSAKATQLLMWEYWNILSITVPLQWRATSDCSLQITTTSKEVGTRDPLEMWIGILTTKAMFSSQTLFRLLITRRRRVSYRENFMGESSFLMMTNYIQKGTLGETLSFTKIATQASKVFFREWN